jgi:hypothetical protein
MGVGGTADDSRATSYELEPDLRLATCDVVLGFESAAAGTMAGQHGARLVGIVGLEPGSKSPGAYCHF